MTEPSSVDLSTDEPPGPARDHPPFKLRERRLVLLPDLRPPSLEELRWSARERRRRREATAPEQRSPASHERLEPREPTDVPATLAEEPPQLAEIEDAAPAEIEDAAPAEIVLPEAQLELELEPEIDPDFFDLYDPEFPDLEPWRPVVLPDAEPVDEAEPTWVSDVRTELPPIVVEPEPEPEPSAEPELVFVEPEPVPEPEPEPVRDELPGEDEPPLVSHVLVVREPVPADPGRIAVLDDIEAPTVTRLVPLPGLPVEASAVEAPAYEEIYPDEPEYETAEADLEVAAEEDRRSAPLYWRLLRLRYTRPNGWLRALYFEGAVALGVVLVLADVASVWTIVVLPLIVAVVVKANDVLAGNLRLAYRQPRR